MLLAADGEDEEGGESEDEEADEEEAEAEEQEAGSSPTAVRSAVRLRAISPRSIVSYNVW